MSPRLVIASLLAASAGALSLAALGCGSGDEPFLNPKADLELCRANPAFVTTKLPAWEGAGPQDAEVRFLGVAGRDCPGRRFPFVDVTSNPALRWIQIVEVNVPVPPDQRGKEKSWQLLLGTEPWMFVDMVESIRKEGAPFLNTGTKGSFWDNPCWPIPPGDKQADGARKWRTRSYGVTSDGKTVRGVTGFSWGWTWTVGASNPEPVAPAVLDRATWKADAERLAAAFPEWTFQ